MADAPDPALSRVTTGAVVVALALYLGLIWLHQFRLAPMAGGLQSPDMHVFGYDAATFKAWVDALGREGRIEFLRLHTFFLDLLFPPAFAFACVMLSFRLGRGVKWFDRMAGLRKLALAAAAPAFYLGFDWSENMAVARMVADPMTIREGVVATASWLTIGKWAFVVLALTLPAVLFVQTRRARAA